jgi:hypothetical protein
MKRWHNPTFRLVGILVGIMMSVIFGASKKSEAASAAPSVAFQLATIDCHCVPLPARVGRIHAGLERAGGTQVP